MILPLILTLMAPNATGMDSGLIGHWRLSSECSDSSGGEHHGINHGVVFSATDTEEKTESAFFDGENSYIEVPSTDALRLGMSDFAISVWVHTRKELDDIPGDILSKYDPEARRGFSLGLMNNAGVASSQSNYRNLLFGIDSAKIDPEWTDCGRPGKSLMVWALTVFEGNLYAGTFETGKDEAGHVYRYAGGTDWVDCGAPFSSNAITSLAVYDGCLYAAASHYRSAGSSIAESENTTLGGRIFHYAGGKDWEDCGELENPEGIFGLVVYRGKLYATSMYSPGLFRYEGDRKWTNCGSPEGRVCPIGVFDSFLYTGSYDQKGVFRYSEETGWKHLGNPEGVTQVYSFASHWGDLYTGTWPDGTVFRYGGGTEWIDSGRLGEEREVMGMIVYNGKLYAGTLPLAQVYRYDDGISWTNTGQLDKTPDVRYRRAWTMAVFDGKLFCGTLPSGHVYSLEAGKSVTYDRELAPGWRHIVATRSGNRLRLFVDGNLAAESSAFDPDDFDISNDVPLRIGSGPQDCFNGSIRDLRIYKEDWGQVFPFARETQ